MTSLTFQIQANPRPHITLARLPEWGVHQHHAPTSEETQILHGKKLQCFHTTLCDVMKPLGPLKNPCGCFQGNYDQYVKTREELEENQMKRFNWEQDQIAHMKVKKTQMTMCYDDHVLYLWMCSLFIDSLLFCPPRITSPGSVTALRSWLDRHRAKRKLCRRWWRPV